MYAPNDEATVQGKTYYLKFDRYAGEYWKQTRNHKGNKKNDKTIP